MLNKETILLRRRVRRRERKKGLPITLYDQRPKHVNKTIRGKNKEVDI